MSGFSLTIGGKSVAISKTFKGNQQRAMDLEFCAALQRHGCGSLLDPFETTAASSPSLSEQLADRLRHNQVPARSWKTVKVP